MGWQFPLAMRIASATAIHSGLPYSRITDDVYRIFAALYVDAGSENWTHAVPPYSISEGHITTVTSPSKHRKKRHHAASHVGLARPRLSTAESQNIACGAQ